MPTKASFIAQLNRIDSKLADVDSLLSPFVSSVEEEESEDVSWLEDLQVACSEMSDKLTELTDLVHEAIAGLE